MEKIKEIATAGVYRVAYGFTVAISLVAGTAAAQKIGDLYSEWKEKNS